MVTLKNLKKTTNTIEADFFPEDSKENGHLVVEVESGKVLSRIDPRGYEGRFSYAIHTKQALLELAQEEALPETYTVMWY